MQKLHVALGVALLGLSAVPAAASPTETVSGSVQVNDLDLASQAGVARFEGRVRSEARALCASGAPISVTMARLTSQCEEAVLASARSQLPQLVAEARDRSARASA